MFRTRQPSLRRPSWLLVALPGFCATFTGIGLGRFAYTALVPALIGSGQVDAVGAGYLGATNLIGYFLGALLAHRLGRMGGAVSVIKLSMILTVAGFAAGTVPLGFWWLAGCRFLVGATGAVLLILAASVILPTVPQAERGRTGGMIVTGVGIGIVLSGLVIAPMATLGTGWVWGTLAGLALIATLISWPLWPAIPAPNGLLASNRPRSVGSVGGGMALAAPLLLLLLGYTLDGAGFVPHSIFWVDFIARDLGFGTAWGSANWLLFGIGAALGPMTVGLIGDRLGLGRTLMLGFAIKAAGVMLPAVMATTATLALSSLVVGALTPGMTALVASRIAEALNAALGSGPAARAEQSRIWGLATLGFSIAQAAGGYGFSYAFARSGSYPPLFVAGGLLEIGGLLLVSLAWRASARPLMRA